VHQDSRVEAEHVGAPLHRLTPPSFLDVALELGAKRAVVEGRAEPAVDVAGGEDESPPLAEVDELLHRDRRFGPARRSIGLDSFFGGQKNPPVRKGRAVATGDCPPSCRPDFRKQTLARKPYHASRRPGNFGTSDRASLFVTALLSAPLWRSS